MLWLSIASIFFTAAHVHLVLGHVLTYGRGHFVRQKDNDTRDPDDPLLTSESTGQQNVSYRDLLLSQTTPVKGRYQRWLRL